MSGLAQCAAEWCFLGAGMDPAATFARLRAAGYAGLELVGRERRAAAAAAGIPVVTMAGPGMQDGMAVPANRAALTAALRASVDEAAAAGIPVVIVFSGNRTGGSDEEGLASCIEGYRALAPYAERAGVTLAFEMLNSRDHAGYMADRSSFGFRLARAVDSPRFRVLYDVYHMHRMGEDVLRDLRENAQVICHVHVAGSPRRDFPGMQQDLDYAAVVRTALAAGYRGWWGQEWPVSAADPVPDLEAARMLFDRWASDRTEIAGTPAGAGDR